MKTPNKSNRLQTRIDLALTALFLATIFFFGIMTVATDLDGLHNAFGSRRRLKGYLADPENYSQWDFLTARIRSLDDYLAENVYMADE